MDVRILIMTVAMAAVTGAVWAKLPPAPPADPAKAGGGQEVGRRRGKKGRRPTRKGAGQAVANYRKNKGIRGPAPKK